MDANLFRSERLGIKLEIANGLPIWEASPVILRQKTVDQIRATIKPPSLESGKIARAFITPIFTCNFPTVR